MASGFSHAAKRQTLWPDWRAAWFGLLRRAAVPALVITGLLLIDGRDPVIAQPAPVAIVSPDGGEILDGTVTLRANVTDPTVETVEFFYRAHDDATPTSVGGLATFDSSSGLWLYTWDTTTVTDTHTEIDGSDVFLTKPPTHDELSVVATSPTDDHTHAIDVRIQNMLTVRFTLPDNQEDLRGFEDLEAVVTGQFEATSVSFHLYPVGAADPRIFVPFGETLNQGFEPIENAHYGRPLGAPDFPTGAALLDIGTATPEGSKRWVLRGWDTTAVEDDTYLLVARAEDGEGRTATYMVETYIVNDLDVLITAPSDGAEVSRFVALEARTSSMTGADNAARGGLWPATEVIFNVAGTNIEAVETPAGSGRWRAVWDSDTDSSGLGPYTITATATNENPDLAETATDSIQVTLVDPGADLAAFFAFDWTNCTLFVCSFLDGSGGGPNSWYWDFGDGETSTEQLPIHTYGTYGVYTVTLTVSAVKDAATCAPADPECASYSRDIPVGNTGAVGFNINPINDGATEFIDWTSAFKNFDYTVGSTLAIPVMWKATTGPTEFVSLPETICDTDPDTPGPCALFTPEEASGTPPTVVGVAQDGVLFTMEFNEVQFRGVTDAFKGKVNVGVVVNVDSGDGDPDLDWQARLGTNVDVTNTGTDVDEDRLVKIISPFEGQFVAGVVPITAGTVSSVEADQVAFYVDGAHIGTDTHAPSGWSVDWDTTSGFPDEDSPYELTAVASFSGIETTSAVRSVNVENNAPDEPDAPPGTFVIGRASDSRNNYLTFPHEIEEEEEEGGGGGGGGGPGGGAPLVPGASMTAEFSDIVVLPGQGVIGGDVLEFDVTITNTSTDPGAILSAFAFQSKVSESPALGSRIGDKLFYGQTVPGSLQTDASSALGTVKKNGTSNGLFSGKWKGICINSSEDFIPEFNSGLEDESLECGGNRADTNFDGEPELLTGAAMRGLRPGETQVIRLRLDSGTTDGALHVIEPGTLQGRVVGTPLVGPNGLVYLVPSIDNTGITNPNVLSMPDFGDNKVLRDADGTFNPTFAPLDDNFTFENQIYLTIPRPNFAFTDIIGRNHSCATYGLTIGACSGGGSPFINFLGTGDLAPGVQNFAAILRGFGEFYDADGDLEPDENPLFPDTGETRPSEPYGVLCENCGGIPYVPVAEFYVDNGGGSLIQSVVGGTYGDPVTEPYLARIDASTADEIKEEIIPEPDPGGPCDPAETESKRPSCAQLRTSATGQFYDLKVVPGGGTNGGDAIEFTIDITNTSTNSEAYLTAFNYQTKKRGLADIGILDGYTQDRRDIRVDALGLDACTGLDDAACYNAALGIGHFPNVIGNGLLFGQMVWTNDNAGREGPVVADQVYVDPINGINPTPFWLESVKKNGPFTPILKGNVNFICVKSGLFDNDPDADAACAGEPAILIDPDGLPIYAPGEPRNNVSQRLGIPPSETQSVRIRMEFGDFRGAMLEIVAGTLKASNVNSAHTSTDGLKRFFDCSDQRELEWCHPHNIGELIGYLPNTDATWMTPATLEEIEYVIINQPGDAPTVMNFKQNFGHILAMAGFVPSAEFYAPDPNPDLAGNPDEGILIRQQVLGSYEPQPIVPDEEEPTPTPEPTGTTTGTPTSTATGTPTSTATGTPTSTATNTPTSTATNTPTHTATNTPTHTATNTPTHTATNTPTHTATNTATSTPTPTVYCGDVTGDGRVTFRDVFVEAFALLTRNRNPIYDVNGDGRLTIVDLRIVISQLGTRCTR